MYKNKLCKYNHKKVITRNEKNKIEVKILEMDLHGFLDIFDYQRNHLSGNIGAAACGASLKFPDPYTSLICALSS